MANKLDRIENRDWNQAMPPDVQPENLGSESPA